MLKLKTLKLKNIGRFTEEQVIHFDRLGNLVQVDAQNSITGGSSGSGKSTIFNSLDWLLGLSDLTTNTLQSRLTKETISVTGIFDWNGKETVVHRSKKLSITIDGQETVGSSKLTEELLDTIIGMPRNLFRPLLHKRQSDQGFFLQLTPSQMNSFLIDCLGLGTLRDKTELVESRIKDIPTNKINATADKTNAEIALKSVKSAIKSLGEKPATTSTPELLDQLKAQYDHLKALLIDKQASYKQEKDLLDQNKPKLTSTPFDRTHLELILHDIDVIKNKEKELFDSWKERQNKAKNEINILKSELSHKISQLDSQNNSKISELKHKFIELKGISEKGIKSQEKIAEVCSHIESLRRGICHVCEQSWITEKTRNEEDKLSKELALLHSSMDDGLKADIELITLKSTISDLNVHYNEQKTSLSTLYDTKIAILNEQATRLMGDTDPEMDELKYLNSKSTELVELKLQEKQKEEKHNEKQTSENNRLMDDFLSKQFKLDVKYQTEIGSISKELEETHVQLERTKSELISHKASLKKYEENLKSWKLHESEYTGVLDSSNLKIAQLTEELEIAQEVRRCLKSYISCSFDDALESISETATRILRTIPTMANASISLEATKETSSGAIKDQVTACLNNDGEIGVPIKSLSGGERSAVDLAIDLAVNSLIQERGNSSIDVLFLDETFGGFDSVGIEHALEMLRNFATDKKVLIVEHDSVAKEFITDKITVVRDGETSSIKSP